ncbi:uncharacterized protein LOC129582916 [Paramacrobiotus metropolitanus]|uniref:uncharacterized protein LOC129582916 n=1 Tax=Paramacrobiotus metropolitanus TaxID=2943436 RepID=UPI0024464AB4|nr:uncharacterized protein LOC129582916 [Paramacrobiotus metropolitanus]
MSGWTKPQPYTVARLISNSSVWVLPPASTRILGYVVTLVCIMLAAILAVSLVFLMAVNRHWTRPVSTDQLPYCRKLAVQLKKRIRCAANIHLPDSMVILLHTVIGIASFIVYYHSWMIVNALMPSAWDALSSTTTSGQFPSASQWLSNTGSSNTGTGSNSTGSSSTGSGNWSYWRVVATTGNCTKPGTICNRKNCERTLAAIPNCWPAPPRPSHRPSAGRSWCGVECCPASVRCCIGVSVPAAKNSVDLSQLSEAGRLATSELSVWNFETLSQKAVPGVDCFFTGLRAESPLRASLLNDEPAAGLLDEPALILSHSFCYNRFFGYFWSRLHGTISSPSLSMNYWHLRCERTRAYTGPLDGGVKHTASLSKGN